MTTSVPRTTSTGRVRPIPGRPPGPDPRRLAGILARTWFEVRERRRPLAQLAPVLAPSLQRRLEHQLAHDPSPPMHPTRVRRVTASWPSPEACEAAVVIERDGRTTALAVRLERHLGAWRVVELTAPEDGLPPLATASLPEGHRRRDAFDEVLEEAGRV
jgi:hypothetical protein